MLFSLLPPSCIVVPIRELVNKQLSSSSVNISYSSIAKFSSNMDIDVNCNNIKKRSALSSKANSRSSLISSSTSSMPYHEYMDMNNNILDDNIQEPIDSS